MADYLSTSYFYADGEELEMSGASDLWDWLRIPTERRIWPGQ
jgi:hypothetical protein